MNTLKEIQNSPICPELGHAIAGLTMIPLERIVQLLEEGKSNDDPEIKKNYNNALSGAKLWSEVTLPWAKELCEYFENPNRVLE